MGNAVNVAKQSASSAVGDQTLNFKGTLTTGIDFSNVSSVTQEMIFSNGAVMSTNSTTAGVKIEDNMTDGDSDRILYVTGEAVQLTAGARQGAIAIYLSRESGYAMTASDGNPDCAMKAQAVNKSASEDYARVRCLDLLAENRDTGAGVYWMEGIYVAVKTRSGCTVNNSGYCYAIKAETNFQSTGTPEVVGVVVNEISQSSTFSALYGVKIQTANYNITRTAAIHISSQNGSWTNGISFNDTITNVFDFENTDGTNGFKVGTFTNNVVAANPDAYVKIDGGGTSYYMPAYSTLPA